MIIQCACSFHPHNPNFPGQKQHIACLIGSQLSQLGPMGLQALPQSENHAERKVICVARGNYEKSDDGVCGKIVVFINKDKI